MKEFKVILRNVIVAIAAAAATAATAAPVVEKSIKADPGGLYQLVFNPADKSVYVAATGQRGANNAAVVKFDAASLNRSGAIDVSANPVFGLGINTRTQTLYGTDTRSGQLVLIDLKTGKSVANLKPASEKPPHVREIVLDEAAGKAYISVVGGAPEAGDNNIWVVDEASRKIERVITVPTNRMTGLAIDAVGKRAFVTGLGAHEVVAVNLTNGEVIGRWPSGGQGPVNVAYDAAGKRLFVTNQGSGELTVLNADTGALLKNIPTGAGALSVAVDPRRNHAYVANRGAGTLTVVDTRNYAVVSNLNTGTLPQSLALDPATGRVFVTNKRRGLPRGAPAGTPVPEDPAGDTLTVVRP
ncbi:YncE family protein [Phenylobacterium sp.]|uniref:YncE family protein n=1 Tax=Phenylobacterium sp. TaxID=1871053 RepID=UPI0037836165